VTATDPLAEIRDQLRAAADAAERLVRDARPDPPPAGRGPGRPDTAGPAPPAGWQEADDGGVPPELLALARLLGVLREILPPELHHQLTDLVRQLLVLLRALIDWAVTRLEQEGPGREPEVEDIRID
jgi:hypothetical protein